MARQPLDLISKRFGRLVVKQRVQTPLLMYRKEIKMIKVQIDYSDGIYSMTRCENQDMPPKPELNQTLMPECLVLAWEEHCRQSYIYQDWLRLIDNKNYENK